MRFSRFEPRGRLKQQIRFRRPFFQQATTAIDKSNPPPHPCRQYGRQNHHPKRRGYHPQGCAAYRQRRTGRYAAGGNVGTAAVGANVDWNNRQLHPDERAWIKQNAKAFAKQENGGKEPTAQQVADAQKRLVHQAVKETDLFWMLTLERITDLPAQDFLKKARQTFLNEDGRQQRFFTTEGKQFVRPEVFAPEAQSDLVFYRNNLHSSKNSSITQGAKDLASKFAKKSWEEKTRNPLKTIIEQSFTLYIGTPVS